MAKAIIGTRKALPDGRIRASMVMLFALSDHGGRVKDAANVDVVPAWDGGVIPATYGVPGAWLTGLGAGDAGYVMHTMEQRHGETPAQFATAAWAAFNVLVPLEVTRRRAEAAGTGEYDTMRFQLDG